MKITGIEIKIESYSAAMDEDARHEICKALRGVANNVSTAMKDEGSLHDTNGNKIGEWYLIGEDEE